MGGLLEEAGRFGLGSSDTSWVGQFGSFIALCIYVCVYVYKYMVYFLNQCVGLLGPEKVQNPNWMKTLCYVTSLDIWLLLCSGANSCCASSQSIFWSLIWAPLCQSNSTVSKLSTGWCQHSLDPASWCWTIGQMINARRDRVTESSRMIHIQSESFCQIRQRPFDDVTKGTDTWLPCYLKSSI